MDVDQIDKIGGEITHEEGPYDALTANRNHQGHPQTQDPIKAFDPQGPNSNPDVFVPQVETEYKMQAHFGVQRDLTDDAPLEGKDSAGLGTTAFVDGSHASAQAIAEQDKYYAESDDESFGHKLHEKFHHHDKKDKEHKPKDKHKVADEDQFDFNESRAK